MKSRVIITGGCGFIGTCLSLNLTTDGYDVQVIDNLSRSGTEILYRELRDAGVTVHQLDLSLAEKTAAAFERIGPVDAVFHLAAQVAVTTSYVDPRRDFLDNALASFNVIEAIKRYTPDAYALISSTNKVYGNVAFDQPVGVNAQFNPYTPYGVSKGVGEMYFIEYGRPEIGLQTCALRQSCIYGHHQLGVEDQGWVAWFSIANLLGRPITIFGDGHQRRDLLFIDDLIALYRTCWYNRISGALPAGGGRDNTLSVLEALELIPRITGKPFSDVAWSETRPGDQPYFVADMSWVYDRGADWRPEVGVEAGVTQMIEWLECNLHLIEPLFRKPL